MKEPNRLWRLTFSRPHPRPGRAGKGTRQTGMCLIVAADPAEARVTFVEDVDGSLDVRIDAVVAEGRRVVPVVDVGPVTIAVTPREAFED